MQVFLETLTVLRQNGHRGFEDSQSAEKRRTPGKSAVPHQDLSGGRMQSQRLPLVLAQKNGTHAAAAVVQRPERRRFGLSRHLPPCLYEHKNGIKIGCELFLITFRATSATRHEHNQPSQLPGNVPYEHWIGR